MDTEWMVKAGLGLFWIYGGRLYTLADDGARDGMSRAAEPQPQGSIGSGLMQQLPPRPARDVLRALLAYTLEQIDAQTARDTVADRKANSG